MEKGGQMVLWKCKQLTCMKQKEKKHEREAENAASEAGHTEVPAFYGSWGLDSRFSDLCLIWSLNYFSVCAEGSLDQH